MEAIEKAWAVLPECCGNWLGGTPSPILVYET